MDLLVLDPVSGRKTGLEKTVRRALRAMAKSRVRYCVIGATALAVRGYPRMTRDLDLAVKLDDRDAALRALNLAGLKAATDPGETDDPEPMVILVDPATEVEVDLLAAAGDPEWTVIEEAPRTTVFGVRAPVATLEHLLLLYLYSNQPRHLGDFARVVQSGKADLEKAGKLLQEMHPEMLRDWKRRIQQALQPPPAPSRPAPRAKRRRS